MQRTTPPALKLLGLNSADPAAWRQQRDRFARQTPTEARTFARRANSGRRPVARTPRPTRSVPPTPTPITRSVQVSTAPQAGRRRVALDVDAIYRELNASHFERTGYRALPEGVSARAPRAIYDAMNAKHYEPTGSRAKVAPTAALDTTRRPHA